MVELPYATRSVSLNTGVLAYMRNSTKICGALFLILTGSHAYFNVMIHVNKVLWHHERQQSPDTCKICSCY